MAPEQLEGRDEAIDARTDVYALGVTLYELVALRLPFVEGNALVMHQDILGGNALPLRQGAAWVSRDLATVVARAMATRPEERYRSAADLARDLTNLLERRPIEARPSGPWTQLVRWIQRNPAAAGLLALVLAVAVLVPLGFAVQQQRLGAREERQRVRAEDNLDDAVAAVREMLARVGKNELKNVPNAEELRLEFLRTAVAFCDDLVARNPDDLCIRTLRASLGEPISEVLHAIGRSDEAGQLLAAHLDELRQLRESGLVKVEALRELAVAVNVQGVLQKDTRRLDEAEASFGEAVALQREAIALQPGSVRDHANLAWMEGNRALVAFDRGELDSAAQGYQRALAASRAGIALDPQHLEMALAHSSTLAMSALIDTRRGESATAGERFEEALTIQARLLESRPDDAELGYGYVRTAVNYSVLLSRRQDCERGREILEGALERARALHGEFPAQLEYHNAFGACLTTLGELLGECGEPDATIDLLTEACDVFDALAVRPGANAEQRMHASQARAALGRALLQAQRRDEALEVLEVARERCEADWRSAPTLGSARGYLGQVRMDLAQLDVLGGGTSGVAEELEDLLPLVRHDPHGLADLASVWVDLASALDGEDARRARTRAVELLLEARDLGFERTRALADSPRWAAARDEPALVAALALEP